MARNCSSLMGSLALMLLAGCGCMSQSEPLPEASARIQRGKQESLSSVAGANGKSAAESPQSEGGEAVPARTPIPAAGDRYFVALAVGTDGIIYLADDRLPGIWRLADGRLTVLFKAKATVGAPLRAIRSLAMDTNGTLLAGDTGTREVYRMDKSGMPIPLTGGTAGLPIGLAVDQAGNCFVADLEYHRILRVPAEGGSAEAVFDVPAPRALVFGPNGDLWIVSHSPQQLLRWSPANGDSKVEPAAAGKPFEFPSAVAVDAAGAVYIADTYASTIWKMEPGKSPVRWASGSPLVSPVALAWNGHDLLAADPRAQAIFRVDSEGKPVMLLLSGAPDAELPLD